MEELDKFAFCFIFGEERERKESIKMFVLEENHRVSMCLGCLGSKM